MFDVHAQLAGPGAEQVAFHADDVADIEQLVERVVLFADRVLANVNLQPLAVLHQMREAGLAHAANGQDAAGDLHRHARLQLLGGLVAVLRQDLRNGVREIETVAVRLKAERFDFRDAADALLVQLVFKRHRNYRVLRKSIGSCGAGALACQLAPDNHLSQMIPRQEEFDGVEFLKQFLWKIQAALH